MIHLPQICLNFLDFYHRLGDKEILWKKRNFGDCKRIFEQAVVEALVDFKTSENKISTDPDKISVGKIVLKLFVN
jgi:hypothetical protein